MIKFNKPKNLNGAELVEELKSNGIDVKDVPSLDGAGDLWLDIAKSDETKAQAVVNAHNGTMTPAELSISDKLLKAGLSLDELKTALGL